MALSVCQMNKKMLIDLVSMSAVSMCPLFLTPEQITEKFCQLAVLSIRFEVAGSLRTAPAGVI